MKSLRTVLAGVLALMATAAWAQSGAQKSFDELKTLAGVWRGTVTATPASEEWNNKPIWVALRVTSRGNAIVHEIKQPGTPDDPKKDDPISMIYLDGDHVTLVHYCDAGNRPRMVAKTSEKVNTVDFNLEDVSGATQYGHMHHASFNVVDADHHSEDWVFMMPGDKAIHAHMDLQRVK
jgi:hypothetical protein